MGRGKKRALWILVCLVLLSLPLVSAEGIQVDIPTDIVVIKDVLRNVNFSITNTNTYDIYNISFAEDSPHFTFTDVPVIAANTTYEGIFQVQTQSAFETDVAVTVSYTTLENNDVDPRTRIVDIDSDLIDPNYIQLFSGDTIQWDNAHSSDLTVRELNGLWSVLIPAGGSGSRVFTTEGYFDYYITETGYAANMTVHSKTQPFYVHDPLTDVTVNIHLQSVLEASSLDITILSGNFTLNFSDVKEGVLRLNTDGTVYNTHLSEARGWITFAENDFDFTGEKYVVFTVDPSIATTNETNRTYNMEIIAIGDNAPIINGLFDIFINYASIEDFANFVNVSPVTIATEEQLRALCALHPDACPTINVTQLVYVNQTTNLTLEIRDIKEAIQRVLNGYNTQKGQLDTVGGRVDAIETGVGDLQLTVGDLLEEEEKRRKQDIMWFILKALFWVGIVCIVGAAAGWLWFTKFKRQRDQEL